MKTFRYVYGSTLGATSETRRQNTAAQAVGHHGRSASGVDEFGGLLLKSEAIRSIMYTDGQKSGNYRRGWISRRKNCPCDLMMGCASETFRKPRGPPSSGIV